MPDVNKEHRQIEWDQSLVEDLRRLVQLAVAEDFGRGQDWTTVSLVHESVDASAAIVPREPGVIAGLNAGALVLDEMDCTATCKTLVEDGATVSPGEQVAILSGPAREILSAERTILNIVGYLSGIATQANAFAQKVAGTKARVYDTRKTLPGYRQLAKYAVRCGGGTNHRGGLNRAVLIKDNHIAFGNAERKDGDDVPGFTVADSVGLSRDFLKQSVENGDKMIVEIEVDTLEQLAKVLPTKPDIILLDNMKPSELSRAVKMRDDVATSVELEASGGVNLDTVAEIAATGVDRISVGALTHSVKNFDVGLDWL